MDIADALAPGVSPEEFFTEKLPALHAGQLDLFNQAFDTALIVCVRLTDTDEVYTVEFHSEGSRVEADEMIDFPVVTIEGLASHWEKAKAVFRELATTAKGRAQRDKPPRKIDREMLDDFERFDGVIDLDVHSGGEHIPTRIILNDYVAPAGARRLEVSVDEEVARGFLKGELSPSEAEAKLKVRGDLGLGVDLVGFTLERYPELERLG